jgi:hypothetical protein
LMETVIFGTTILAQLLTEYMRDDGFDTVAAYTVERSFLSDSEFMGKLVVPFEELQQRFPPEQYQLLVAVGYHEMNRTRERIFRMAKEMGYHLMSYIHPTATVLVNPWERATSFWNRRWSDHT